MSYDFSNLPKNDNCSSIEGPILVPGKDRFLRQRCGAQFVSVRATRFLAAKAVTGSCTPGGCLPGCLQSSTQNHHVQKHNQTRRDSGQRHTGCDHEENQKA